MGGQHKWARVVIAAGLAGVGAVLFDPLAPAALALVAPPAPPITVPSSVIGSLDSATALERARMIGNTAPGLATGWRVPVSASGNILKSVGAGSPSPFTVGVTGFFLGFEGANIIMRMAGVDDVGLEAFLPPSSAVTYVANSDLGAAPEPGWAPSNVFTSQSAAWNPAVMTVHLTQQLTYQAGGTIAGSVVLSGSCTPSGIWGPNLSIEAVYKSAGNVNTYASGAISGAMFSGGQDCGGLTGWLNASVPATRSINWVMYYFDHLEVWSQYRPSDPRIIYWPVGNPARPAEQSSDPVRVWETRWQCPSASASSLRSEGFLESWPEWPMYPDAECAGGLIPQWVEVWEVTPTGEAEDVLLESWTPTQPLLDWQTNYPQCVDGSCRLLLSRIDPTTGLRLSCFANPSLCLDWWTSPTRADEYECTYGGGVVALDECAAYAPTFNVATGVDVQTETGPKPAGETGPYADPATGEPVPADNPTPAPEAGTSEDACPPPFSWTALFNPWWYYKGFTCGLEWAFVPPAGQIQTEVQVTTEVLSTRPPWSLVEPIGAVFTGLGDGWSAGCSLLPDFDPYGHGLQLPCDPPQSAWMTVLRALGTFVVVVGTGFGVWHMVVAAIGGRQADS